MHRIHDQLPPPVSVTDIYLSELLGVMQDVRAALVPPAAPAPAEDEEVVVKEPESSAKARKHR